MTAATQGPRRVYEWVYPGLDSRKHRHRCLHCNRIVTQGVSVLAVRTRNKVRVVHLDPCADLVAEPTSGINYRRLFELWAEI